MRTQNPLVATPCGFKSHHRHQQKAAFLRKLLFFFVFHFPDFQLLKTLFFEISKNFQKSVDRGRKSWYYNNRRTEVHNKYADVAELADALDSGSSGSNTVWVQIPSSAPTKEQLSYEGCSFALPKRFTLRIREAFMMYDIAALGELLIDFSEKQTDPAGYPTMEAHPGGAPANFLAALSQYRCKTAFLGKVGEDAFGRLLTETLNQAGIDTRGLIRDPSVFTTLAFVTLDKSGDRSFSFARKPGADTRLKFEELDLSILDESRAFHFGTLSLTDEPVRTATQKAAAYAREHGLLITFDPNLRKPLWNSEEDARHWMLWGLAQADVVKISDEEADFLWGCSPEEGADHLLRDYGVQLAMVTCGPNGCLLKNRIASCQMRTPSVNPVDTTGAGDIFGGSAVSCILALGQSPDSLNKQQLSEIARFASAAASLSTQQPGGISSIPSLEQVQALCARTDW